MKILFCSILRRVFWLFGMLVAGITLAQSTPAIVWSTNLYSIFPVLNVAFSGDGTLLISSAGRTTSVWRVSDKSLVRAFSLSTEAISAAISPDRTLLGAGASGGGNAVWRLSDGLQLRSSPNSDVNEKVKGIRSLAFSADSSAVAFGRGGGIILSESQNINGLPFENPSGQDGNERGVFDVRFSPDGTLLASANEDGTASLFRMPEGTLIRDLTGHGNRATSVDFSRDGRLLASCAWDGTARLWRVEDGAALRTLNTGFLYGRTARFSADGKTLVTSFEGTSGQRALQFWRVSDGKLLLSYTNINSGPIAVSPDGKHFAYGTGTVYDTNAAVVLARMPLLITNAGVRTNAFQLEWQGGTGTYHVEQRTNLSAGPWELLAGPVTNTNLTVPMTNSSSFFRVQSVDTPP